MNKKSYTYPIEVYGKTEITTDIACFIEGYAMALAKMMGELTCEPLYGKSYDPMTIEGNTAHSYIFDMKDGGRHHDLTLYKDVGEILDILLKETIVWVEQDD